MCVGINGDMLASGERAASTSNRNFEGRQGQGGQTPPRQPSYGGRGLDHGPIREYQLLRGGTLMEPLIQLNAIAAPLRLANVNTDQLFPARFIKKPRAVGYAQYLFHDIRRTDTGNITTDFCQISGNSRPPKFVCWRKLWVWKLKRGSSLRTL